MTQYKKKCLKYFVISFNVVAILTGCGAVAVGIWMLFDPGLMDIFFGNYKFLHPAAILIGAGLLTLFTTFCGFCGAMKENKYVVRAYLVFLIAVMIADFGAGGIAFSYRTTINAEIRNQTETLIKTRYGTGDRQVDNAVDLLQEKYACCGAYGNQDYRTSNWIKPYETQGRKTVPHSCCTVPAECADRTKPNLVRTKGCVEELHDMVNVYYLLLGGLSCGFGCMQLIGVCLGYFLNDVYDDRL